MSLLPAVLLPGSLWRQWPDFLEARMRFEHELGSPYVEPVPAAELIEGEVYFLVTYADPTLLLPSMEAMVFLGRDLNQEDSGFLYFQDALSYRDGVRFGEGEPDGGAHFVHGLERELRALHYEQAIDDLLHCLLRRRRQ